MKNKNNLFAVILAGGVGSRFWPLSRQFVPKQFLRVNSKQSLLQQTILRIIKLVPSKRICIISNQHYFFEIKKELARFKIPEENIFLEPIGKNTAPAIALAAKLISLRDPNSTMMVLPSDHVILDNNSFINTIKKAYLLAQDNFIITLGIKPRKAMTGYGYIKATKIIDKRLGGRLVDKFIEKPSKDRVKKFIEKKNYYWNSGIFIWKTQAILNEIKRYLPALFKQVNSIRVGEDIKKIWNNVKPISIDYGVLERSKKVAMMSANFDWSDIGSWQALRDILKKDKSGNILKGDSLDIDGKNVFVWSKDRFVATLGLKDIIIIDTPDAILACKDDYSEQVRKIVDFLKNKKREEYLYHKRMNRPWGSYTVLQTEKDFKVKLVEIEPKSRLSLQMHRRRAEHWVVVEGRAKVTRGNKVRYVSSNQSIYIPARKLHRLENALKNKTLKIVEVQTGSYLKEDDIVRFKDDYNRI